MRQHPRIIPARCTHVSGLSSPVDAAQLPPALRNVPPGASLPPDLSVFLNRYVSRPRDTSHLRGESPTVWRPTPGNETPPF
jgi:hypothetical protein